MGSCFISSKIIYHSHIARCQIIWQILNFSGCHSWYHAQRKSYQWYSYRKNPPDFEIMPAFAPLLAQNDPVLQRFTKNSREIRLTKLSKNKKNSTWTSWGLALPRCWPEMTPNRAQNHRCWPPRPSQHHSQSNHVQHEASFAKYLTRF